SEKDNDYIKLAMGIIKESLTKLKNEYEVIVMEGAGSPAEVNISDKDLANMKVAKLFNSPVILVADIDRGGVFASIVGTMELLGEDRKHIKGIIINKFRGDKSSLKSGIDFIEKRTNTPVLGVIPYFNDIDLPEEDSVSINEHVNENAEIRIGVINLPHLSNFTDFDVFNQHPLVELRYIDNKVSDLEKFDLLIIPGTKNTTEDLKYLKKTDLAEKIIKAAKNNVQVIGICGGYQMLGDKLIDPNLTEGETKQIDGLGLLDIETRFSEGKNTYQIKADINQSPSLSYKLKETEIEGYEIHMGESILGNKASPMFNIKLRSGYNCLIKDGAVSKNYNVWGTYIHGIFDNDDFRQEVINHLLEKKTGQSYNQKEIDYKKQREKQINELAKKVKKNIDLEKLYEIMDLEEKL
ncbi:MAG: cobyric acid synthase, partial [Bacillota bacterium]